MKNWKITILFTIVIIFTFSSIVLSGLWKDKSTIRNVVLAGNITLSKDEIFEFAKLNDSLICGNHLSMEMIETRIGKHPNIKKVEVNKDGATIKIDISEKNPFAAATNGNEVFLVDDQLTVYNIKKEQSDLDIPVISGLSRELGPGTYGKDDLKNLKIGQYLISQAIKINKSVFNYISEISFADHNGIALVTSDDATMVYFIDYESIARKEKPEAVRDVNSASLRNAINKNLVSLNGFLKQVRVYRTSNSFRYIDMRYNDMIIVKNNNLPAE
ncbi:MAG: hypothetical protein JNK43_06205 [Ignavibacteria bacterium]|nr:hypothetical protein [Ignavibacteria bacterium]